MKKKRPSALAVRTAKSLCRAVGDKYDPAIARYIQSEMDECHRMLTRPNPVMEALRKSRGKKLKGDVGLNLRTGP